MRPISVLLLAAAAAAQQSDALFDAPLVPFPSTSSIDSVADLDGDGDLDGLGWYFRYTSGTNARVRSFLNDGRGAFTADWSLDLPINGGLRTTWALATGSFDGDARADFVIAFGPDVWCYTSRAGAPPLAMALWKETFDVTDAAVVDADGDGRDDVVLAGAELRLYRNTGNGFALASTYPLATDQIRLAELDGDGDRDLAAIAVGAVDLIGLRGGALTRIGGYGTGIQPSEKPMLVAGDVDGDGDDDIAVFAEAGTYVLIRRTAPDAFAVEPRVSGGPATGLADLDGDGDLDGVCCGGGGPITAHNTGTSIYHLSHNDGSGRFTRAQTIRGVGAKRLAGAVDLDGDGDTDLIAGRSILFNQDTFVTPPVPGMGKLGYFSVALGDHDRDGDPDPVVHSRIWLRNDGTGALAVAANAIPAAPAGTYFRGDGFVGDFDGDGDTDAIVGHTTLTTFLGMRLLRNVGGRLVDAGYAGPQGVDFHPDSSLFQFGGRSVGADFDGDGDLDLVVGPRNSTFSVRVWQNDGTGVFSRAPDHAQYVPSRADDLDGDGHLDLITGVGTTISVSYGRGDCTFEARAYFAAGLNAGWDRIGVGDLDGDGRLDLAAGDSSVDGYLYLWLNQGGRTFSQRTLRTTHEKSNSGEPLLIDAVDADGDGDTDLILSKIRNAKSTSAILLNDGSGAFPRQIEIALQARGFADLDGDGDLDAIDDRVARSTIELTPGAGWRRQHGSGAPGAGAIVPVLGAVGPFVPGGTVELRLACARAGAPAAVVFGPPHAGLAGWPWPGLTGYVAPVVLAVGAATSGPPGAAGEGAAQFAFAVPAGLAGVTIGAQAFVADPGAPVALSHSNGLELRFAR